MANSLAVIKTIDNYVYEGTVISEDMYEIVMEYITVIVPECGYFEYGKVVHFQKANIIWRTDKNLQ